MSSHTFQSLVRSTPAQLEEIIRTGTAPTLESLRGWEFRGYNVLPFYAHAIMWTLANVRFVKVFVDRDPSIGGPEGTLSGYNLKVRRGTPDEPWTCTPSEEKPARIGYYTVYPKRTTGKKYEHPNALFLDYDNDRNNLFTGRTLEDYVVQVPGNPDLIVGKAYFSLGLRPGFHFVAERYRKHAR